MELDIIHIALNNLEKNTGIRAIYKAIAIGRYKETDGEIVFNYHGKRVKRFVEVKTELRSIHIHQIIQIAEQFKPLILIARTIFPKLKDELREKQIDYLDADGNIFLKADDLIIHIDGNKNLNTEKEKVNRAFMKTGLKTVFHFLIDNELVNHAYREIAEKTDVALGNVKYVMDGLRENGYLVKLDKKRFKLINKKDLLDKWIDGYAVRLKPTLIIDRFRFLNENDFQNWKNIKLKTGATVWGGEPGGDILTNYLKPGELTMYTGETRKELMMNYRLIPDQEGNVVAYKKFWKEDDKNLNVAPPLLVYVDLMINGDRRSMETAQKIYNERIEDKF